MEVQRRSSRSKPPTLAVIHPACLSLRPLEQVGLGSAAILLPQIQMPNHSCSPIHLQCSSKVKVHQYGLLSRKQLLSVIDPGVCVVRAHSPRNPHGVTQGSLVCANIGLHCLLRTGSCQLLHPWLPFLCAQAQYQI